MGAIKTSEVKNLAEDLIREHGDRFSESFEDNKKVLHEIKPIKSKKVRNVVAGYLTTRMKQIQKSGI
ncbi:MAG TPA: 30S ribosomal protein S17e [archaeon]|nr:30S ribosomal protein S17e [archaeon]